MEISNRFIIRQIEEQTVSLSDVACEKLALLLVRKELKKGELFLEKGTVCRHIGYVYKGLVRQYYSEGKKEETNRFVYERSFFTSKESCFREKDSFFNIEALEPTIVYLIPYDDLKCLGKDCHEIYLFYTSLLENMLIAWEKRMALFRVKTAHERYKCLMQNEPEVIKRAPLFQIASYLQMTPETLSRVRATIL